jgi:hypothetical protein
MTAVFPRTALVHAETRLPECALKRGQAISNHEAEIRPHLQTGEVGRNDVTVLHLEV